MRFLLRSAVGKTAKSKRSHYQFEVFVCVSLISMHMQIIVRMRSIGVLMLALKKVTFGFAVAARSVFVRLNLFTVAPLLLV